MGGLHRPGARAAGRALALVVLLAASGAALRARGGAGVQEAPPADACAALSARDPRLAPLSALCVFAQQYRRSLPNFVCDQKTTRTPESSYYERPDVITAEVTYQDGRERYDDVRLNGKPVAQGIEALPGLKTFGEFGSDLVELFTPPIEAQFTYAGEERIGTTPAVAFQMLLPAAGNRIWRMTDNHMQISPEFRGTLWVEKGTSRLLRLRIDTENLEPAFSLDSARISTDYAEVRLEGGTFLLPVASDTHACERRRMLSARRGEPPRVELACFRNRLEFRACRKFGAKTRIVPE